MNHFLIFRNINNIKEARFAVPVQRLANLCISNDEVTLVLDVKSKVGDVRHSNTTVSFKFRDDDEAEEYYHSLMKDISRNDRNVHVNPLCRNQFVFDAE